MTKRRLPVILASAPFAVLAIAPIAGAAQTRGLLRRTARVLGHSMTQIAVSYVHWILDDPVQPVDCAQSPLDARIWFLPEVTSEGGVPDVACTVPAGSFLVIVPGFWECSSLEDEPFHATNESELIDCVNAGFEIHRHGRDHDRRPDVLGPRSHHPPDAGHGHPAGQHLQRRSRHLDDEGLLRRHVAARPRRAPRPDRCDLPEFGFEGITDYTITVG